MSRRGKLTPEVVEAIQERRRAGLGYAELSRMFGLSHGSIAAALHAEPSPSTTAPPSSAATPSERLPLADAPEVGRTETSDLRALLARQVAALEELANAARGAKDVSAFASLSRVLNATTALLAKITPPPAPDPNESPDMIAIAKRAREKLHALVDRALKDRAE